MICPNPVDCDNKHVRIQFAVNSLHNSNKNSDELKVIYFRNVYDYFLINLRNVKVLHSFFFLNMYNVLRIYYIFIRFIQIYHFNPKLWYHNLYVLRSGLESYNPLYHTHALAVHSNIAVKVSYTEHGPLTRHFLLSIRL